ncbi:ArsR/SmtB family transcription factor [Actinopolymorpha alba]|uniref:ArsR/SmtB family transcription factor n=1 Tax=Actinopolymorpha alba TaxID=533267 RepID=UPI000380E503|nr:helix-turn-helix domain-containing protein [Actinopolymorpha alba]
MSLEVAGLRALAHPTRLRILSLLTGTAMSAAEIARELDITQANASYHVRTLAAASYLVEVGEENIRGGVAKRYAYVLPERKGSQARRSEPEVMEEAQVLVYQAMAEELIRRARQAVPAQPQHWTDAELWVDQEDWDHAMRLVREASDVLHRRAHPPRTDGTIHVSATAALFRMRDEPRSTDQANRSDRGEEA